jgi:uncharacterized protein
MENLSYSLELKDVREDGVFEGYASTFGNRDLGGDIVEQGAFSSSLAQRGAGGVKMLLDHDPAKRVGVWESLAEDSQGLYVRGRLLVEKQIGREAYVDLKAGALDAMSIGFRINHGGADYDDRRRVRKIKSVDLLEISLVTFPMNTEARVMSVKAADNIKTIREFEDFLRDVGGFSHAAAKSIASRGFKSSDPRDEADAQALAEMIRRNISTLSR